MRASEILEETQRGNEVMVTLRGKPAAILKPIEKRKNAFKKIGFGLWKDRKDMQEPAAWVSERRRERRDHADAL
ncbi:MAG: hypothetical protein A2Z19_01195 [Deltaproteobacteria bacterium RBG_16_54_18]|nr:MAG: hypothetical protein A2Z19_01195 [Deltaproteobacteria bacterium RBG_16_54_18]